MQSTLLVSVLAATLAVASAVSVAGEYEAIVDFGGEIEQRCTMHNSVDANAQRYMCPEADLGLMARFYRHELDVRVPAKDICQIVKLEGDADFFGFIEDIEPDHYETWDGVECGYYLGFGVEQACVTDDGIPIYYQNHNGFVLTFVDFKPAPQDITLFGPMCRD